MKKYLFGLGTMLVGAGLMFVLMHGEVSAESEVNKPDIFVCSAMATFPLQDKYEKDVYDDTDIPIIHCQTKHLDCGYSVVEKSISCVKRGGLFK